MEKLKKKILSEGRIGVGNVLKVDGFLNHRMDVDFLCEVGQEFYRLFGDQNVTKILTVEASGIGIACLAAQYFHVPVVFAKKSVTSNISAGVYMAKVDSYTHKRTNDIVVSRDFLCKDDRVLIIDDFLAKGCALLGMVSICREAGATVVGAGIVIEKAYQGGGDAVREMGIRVESLAKIAAMSEEEGVTFLED